VGIWEIIFLQPDRYIIIFSLIYNINPKHNNMKSYSDSDERKSRGRAGLIKIWLGKKYLTARILFVIMGVASTIWFLIRVIPKPSRAGYPCVRAAAPLMSGFFIYLLSLGGITISFRRAMKSLRGSRYLTASLLLVVAVFFLVLNISSDLSVSSARPGEVAPPDDGPNKPYGTGLGIKPGHVVWAWDPDATNEKCKNSIVNNDWYFSPGNADQKVIEKMFSESVAALTGSSDLKQAWDGLFRYHNMKRKHEDRGYLKGEKIFIKINQGTASWVMTKDERENGYTISDSLKPGQERRLRFLGATETSPYVVLEILRALVDIAGVDQENIYVGDPISHIYGHNYSVWHAQFPDVKYIDRFSERFERTLVKPTEDILVYYSDKSFSDKFYDVIESADYMINAASLKPHGSAGVTLTVKNHFGSQGRPSAAHLHYSLIAPTWEKSPREVGNPTNGGYKKYRSHVDLMGSSYLGRNTMLYIVEGLFGGGADETRGPVKYFMSPFCNDWSNSLFISQDQVAIESVCLDFLKAEWNGINIHSDANNVFEEGPNMFGVDDYLHQAADSSLWPEGIIYDPDNSGQAIPSLGVHEHWNNAVDKQYSGNMGLPNGITLVSIPDSLVAKSTLN
jgi:hypothetical protein